MQVKSVSETTSKEINASTIDRILTNALDHFSIYGYVGASVRSITESSGVTKPTLYYYFKNKQELYSEVARRCFESVLNPLRKAAQEGTTTAESFMNVLKGCSSLCDKNLSVVKFVFLIGPGGHKGTPDVGALKCAQDIDGIVREIVEAGAKKGDFSAEKIEPVSFLLSGLLLSHVRCLLFNNSGQTPQQHQTLVENSLDYLLQCSKVP